MPARIVAPGLGAVSACCDEGEGSPYLLPGELFASISFRYLHSFRDFHGDDEVPTPSPRPLFADTHVYGFLLTAIYQMTPRFSLTLDIPIQSGTRRTYYEHDPFTFRHLYTMEASGVGDLRLAASGWLFDPQKYRTGNISLGLGVKVPSGNDDAMDISHRPTGPILRPVDPAIQPGNGGWGIVFEVDAFQRLYKRTYAYLQGAYIAEPRDRNDTEQPLGDVPIPGISNYWNKKFKFNSVPDSYLGRAGVGYLIWPKYGFALTIGSRIEGVPDEDLIGGSFSSSRFTGYSVYVEPGLTIARDRYTFNVTGPVAGLSLRRPRHRY